MADLDTAHFALEQENATIATEKVEHPNYSDFGRRDVSNAVELENAITVLELANVNRAEGLDQKNDAKSHPERQM